MIDTIRKIPFNQRLIIGKILLLLVFPIILLILLVDSICNSAMYFFDYLRGEVKHELGFFIDYMKMKGKLYV